MIINYKINEEIHNIIISDKIKNNIINQVELANSDKKILFVYDEKIKQSLVNLIRDQLKLNGANLILVKLFGNKKNKNNKVLFRLIDVLISNQFTKKSILISCGGGVVGDISNLAASLYLRGMIYFHIPSTMTAIMTSTIWMKTSFPIFGTKTLMAMVVEIQMYRLLNAINRLVHLLIITWIVMMIILISIHWSMKSAMD